MNDIAGTPLDTAEQMRLSLHAIQRGDHEGALLALEKLLAVKPDHAEARYLLAAEHAQFGQYERAIEGMQAALALEPGLSMARFQLGLLFLTAGREGDAAGCFRALQTLPPADPLHWFAAGLVAAIGQDVATAGQQLARGIELNTSNVALNHDMQRVSDLLGQVEAAAPADAGSAAARHYLSMYGKADKG